MLNSCFVGWLDKVFATFIRWFPHTLCNRVVLLASACKVSDTGHPISLGGDVLDDMAEMFHTSAQDDDLDDLRDLHDDGATREVAEAVGVGEEEGVVRRQVAQLRMRKPLKLELKQKMNQTRSLLLRFCASSKRK